MIKIIEQHNKNENIKSFKSEYIPSDKYKIDEDINLWQGDCLELMNHIPDKSIDMILCDLPYGTTACSWDETIPFEPLWSHYKRIIKDNGAIVLFSTQPFTTKLINSNIANYKHNWVWKKSRSGSAITAKYCPVKRHEDIVVFSKNGETVQYYPIMREGDPYYRVSKNNKKNEHKIGVNSNMETINNGTRYPITTIEFKQDWSKQQQLHPTQKPVALLEYLIKTYTNKGMVVLDNTMGSGSTGVACKNTNRRSIGIELEERYFNIAKDRIENIE